MRPHDITKSKGVSVALTDPAGKYVPYAIKVYSIIGR